MIYKECACCREPKFAFDFSPEREGKFGLKSYCKDCMAAKQRERRKDPSAKERDKLYRAKYEAEHPGWAKAQNDSPAKRANNAKWSRETLSPG